MNGDPVFERDDPQGLSQFGHESPLSDATANLHLALKGLAEGPLAPLVAEVRTLPADLLLEVARGLHPWATIR